MSNIFEVNKILDDKIENGTSFYLIEWKDTKTKDILLYSQYEDEIKKARFGHDHIFTIQWKLAWMCVDEVKDSCDELLGAYLLLKLRNYQALNIK